VAAEKEVWEGVGTCYTRAAAAVELCDAAKAQSRPLGHKIGDHALERARQ